MMKDGLFKSYEITKKLHRLKIPIILLLPHPLRQAFVGDADADAILIRINHIREAIQPLIERKKHQQGCCFYARLASLGAFYGVEADLQAVGNTLLGPASAFAGDAQKRRQLVQLLFALFKHPYPP